MAGESRTKNSIFNLASGFGYRLLSMLMSFVVRTVFIHYLSEEYLGINGLYSNILSLLSLAELGFGTAMCYSMYKPLADRDYDKLAQLMVLYRKVYAVVGTVILVIGLALVPGLPYLIKDQPKISGLTFYYLLFLLNSVVSYWFFSYRTALFQADQKAHIVTNYSSAFVLIKSVLQIIVLAIFHNFTVYLLMQLICTIGQNIALSVKANRMYPVFGRRSAGRLPREESSRIFSDVRALMLSKISHVALNSTDNLIVSRFVGLGAVGLLSNFVLISDAVMGILCQITAAVSGSLGNYFAKEDKQSGYRLFCRLEFLNFWLYGCCFLMLNTLLNPFISIWLGPTFCLSRWSVFWMSMNFFVAGFMNTIYTFRSTLGLFTQGRYRPLIVTALNIGLSILLSFPFGLAGVLAATSLSRACVNLWYDPWLVLRRGFGISPRRFFLRYAGRMAVLLSMAAGLSYFGDLIMAGGTSLLKFASVLAMAAVVPNLIFFLVYRESDNFSYFKAYLLRFLAKKHF